MTNSINMQLRLKILSKFWIESTKNHILYVLSIKGVKPSPIIQGSKSKQLHQLFPTTWISMKISSNFLFVSCVELYACYDAMRRDSTLEQQ